MGALTMLGIPPVARTTWLTREIPRTSIEFLAAATLKQGQPVKLNGTGGIVAWAQADGPQKLIGYLLWNVTSGDLTTVMTRGMAVQLAIAHSAGVTSGLGAYSSYDSSTAVVTSNGQADSVGYPVYQTVVDGDILTKPHAWILETAAAGILIRVLLMN